MMAATASPDVVFQIQQLMSMDATLLHDVLIFSPSNALHLTRRLESAVKVLSQGSGSLDLESPKVCDHITQLVHCYVAAGETSKVARGLEKMLIATGPACQEFIKTALEQKLQGVLETSTTKDLQKVSAMLEQSQMVQDVISKLLPLLARQLSRVFTEFDSLTPTELNKDELDKFCITTKLSLQVFQWFPEVRQSLWSGQVTVDRQSTEGSGLKLSDDVIGCFRQIASGVFLILVSKIWPRETTLLAGTAAAMIINSAPSPDHVTDCFFNLYDSVSTGVSVKFGALQLDVNVDTTRSSSYSTGSRTADIALLRSMISSASDTVMCYTLPSASPKSAHFKSETIQSSESVLPPAFVLTLFPLVCKLCDSGTEFQYLSFQLLSQWYKKLTSCLPALIQQNEKLSLMGKESEILRETLSRLWVSWDSPVDGVAEFVVDTFRVMLEVWQSELTAGRSNYPELSEELVTKVLQRPWYDRSRYKPLALLVPFVDTDKLLIDHGCLKSELQQCMGTSFLAALASDVYAAFLQTIRKRHPEEQQVERWWEIWGTCVVTGLTHSDGLVRQKICAYWLPATVKTILESGRRLQQHLEGRLCEEDSCGHQALLFAWVTVCRHIRNLVGMDIESLGENLLVEAVYSDDEDVCAQALSLLCGTHKKAEPLKDTEMRLLRSALPYCLKVDSAPFRQLLITSLRKLFVRVRDSCSTAIKRKTITDFVDMSVEFMDWLYHFCIANLFPGASFQRRRTCLDIIRAWFETVIFVQSDGAKKGKAQGPTDVLLRFARSKGQWDWFSPDNRISLLYCVTDGADEIQESALHLLGKYFPWSRSSEGYVSPTSPSAPHKSSLPTSVAVTATSKTACVVCTDDLAVQLLRHGLELCNSPRGYENHSGALLVRLVFEKYVRQQGRRFQVSMDGQTDALTITVVTEPRTTDKGEDCAAFFNHVLIKLLNLSLQAAQRDALAASKHHPTHGVMQALCECLRQEQQSAVSMNTNDWMSVLHTAISLSTSIITLMLILLAGGQKESCPSFAEMGVALDQLVAAEGEMEQEVTSSLSPEFQLLLSWCWLNLKESCTCLGEAVAAGTKSDMDSCERLTAETVEGVGETFLRVLTNCRHRGAIEGCRNGFHQFCMSLMLSDDRRLSDIPTNILRQLLTSLEKDEMTSSVTRRSAGLPIIVQTVTQAERKCKSNQLLQESVRRLYAIASCFTDDHHSQTQDQASVHALNVLKSVFSDASLAGDLLSHLGKAVQLVIQSFESPSWAIRNAATQFVSTLVTRMFGQRNKASLSCNTLTLQEFSAHFPELLDFVAHKMESVLAEKDRIADVQPSLFLILTLLSSLGPAANCANSHRLTNMLRTQVLTVVSSPVYYLRELSASAAVALTPLDVTEAFVEELLAGLEAGSKHQNSNYIHGTLMCLGKLLTARSFSSRTAEKVVEFVLCNKWLLSPDTVCPFVSAKCVDVLHRVVFSLHSGGIAVNEHLVDLLTGLVFAPAIQMLQVGQALLKSSVVSLVVTLLQSKTSNGQLLLQEFCMRCLHSADVEVRLAILECFPQNAVCLDNDANIMACLWKSLEEETDPICVVKSAKIFTALGIKKSFSADPLHRYHQRLDIDPCHDLVMVRSRFHRLAGVQAALFPVEALFIAGLFKSVQNTKQGVSVMLCDWSERLQAYSCPHQNEDFRLAAAQGLHIAGPGILEHYRSTQDVSVESTVVRLLETCLTLLEETDSDVRMLATQFVGHLHWDKKYPQVSDINSNLCLKVLLAYVRDELAWSRALWDFLLNNLYTPADLSACLQKQLAPRSNYLFEHEENTFYSEKLLQQEAVFQTVLEMCQSFSGQADYVVSALSVLISELKACVAVLETNAAGLPVYNMWGESGVMISLTGLVYQARVLTQCFALSSSKSQVGADLPQQLTEELSRIVTIPNIHPALLSFLSRVQ